MSKSYFALAVEANNVTARKFVEFIDEHELQPSRVVAATNNIEGGSNSLICCDKNSFNTFKGGRSYKLNDSELSFRCSKSYKYVESGGYTVFFGKITFAEETLPVTGWRSEEFTSLRKKLGLSVPDGRKTKAIECLQDAEEYVEGVMLGVKKHADALALYFTRYGVEAPAELDSVKNAIRAEAKKFAEAELEAFKAEREERRKQAEEKETLRKNASKAGLGLATYIARKEAEAERERAASLEAQLAEALSKIETLTKGQNKPRTKK